MKEFRIPRIVHLKVQKLIQYSVQFDLKCNLIIKFRNDSPAPNNNKKQQNTHIHTQNKIHFVARISVDSQENSHFNYKIITKREEKIMTELALVNIPDNPETISMLQWFYQFLEQHPLQWPQIPPSSLLLFNL